MAQNADAPREIFLRLRGAIDENTPRLVNDAFLLLLKEGYNSAHLLIQCHGGRTEAALAINNWLKSLPIALTTYNCSYVESAGLIVFLAAKRRKSSGEASFMTHEAMTLEMQESHTPEKWKEILDGVARANQGILKTFSDAGVILTEEQLFLFKYDEVRFSSREALRCHLVDEIADFSCPPGQILRDVQNTE